MIGPEQEEGIGDNFFKVGNQRRTRLVQSRKTFENVDKGCVHREYSLSKQVNVQEVLCNGPQGNFSK